MITFNKIVIFFILISQTLGQSIDSPCTLKSTGSPGKCKLLNDCQQIRDDVIHYQLPQVCGSDETRSIVCCPLSGKREVGEISKEKCREYSSYAYKGPSGATANECGHTIVKRIVGGDKVSRKEFAHMALIGFKEGTEETQWWCGGTLISDQYILTSANCHIRGLSVGEAKVVKLGVTDINDNDKKQEFKIAELIQHPDYHLPLVYNDIALIKLDKPVTLHSHVRPACLYTKDVISAEKGIATRWGLRSFAGERSDHLLKVSLKVVTNEFCNTIYNNTSKRRHPRGIDEATQICTESGDEQEDTCQGDSGGPLQIYHSADNVECMYDIIGITSFGKTCFGFPGVYTRVSHYVKWIEDIVWPDSSK